MNIIENRLTSLEKGTRVRIIPTNGNVIEGVVTENDKSESLCISICSEAILKYSGILGVEIIGQEKTETIPIPTQTYAAVKQTEPVQPVEEDEKNVKSSDIEEFNAAISELEDSFKQLTLEQRNALQPYLSKCRDAVKNNNSEKLKAALKESWQTISDNDWDYDHKANIFHAYISCLAEDCIKAAEDFYFGDDVRKAYLCAYSMARKEGTKELYTAAGTFAVIYILNNLKNEYFSEALLVAEKCCEMSLDASGLYILAEKPELKDDIVSLAKRICQHKNIFYSNDITLLESLKAVCTNSEIGERVKDYIDETREQDEQEDVTDKNGMIDGQIIKYNILESKGIIESKDKKRYNFSLKSITDVSLKKQLEKIKSSKEISEEKSIVVKFTSSKFGSEIIAENVKRGTGVVFSIDDLNKLFYEKKYEEIIKGGEKLLTGEGFEIVFSIIIKAFLALKNAGKEQPYQQNINDIINKYKGKLTIYTSLNSLQNYYMAYKMHKEAIEVIDKLIVLSSRDENKAKQLAYFLEQKATCCENLGYYAEGIETLERWIQVVENNNLENLYNIMNTSTYIRIAELYLLTEEYSKALEYAAKAKGNPYDQKDIITKCELALRKNEPAEDEEPAEDAEEFYEQPEETAEEELYSADDLDNFIAEYSDTDNFDKLGMTEEDIVNETLKFKNDKLYCLIAYISAAAYIAKGSSCETDLKAAELAFRLAFGIVNEQDDTSSSNVIGVFALAKEIIPEISDNLFIASSLRTLFNESKETDYGIETLIDEIQNTAYGTTACELANKLNEFRLSTGVGIDTSADYRVGNNALENILEQACNYREQINGKLRTFESQGQVRRTRECIFGSNDSVIKTCFDAVCGNQTEKAGEVENKILSTFIRSGKEISSENIDKKKLDEFIDNMWIKARDEILSEKKTVARPNDKLKGSKRTNVIKNIEKIIDFIGNWLYASKHISGVSNDFANQKYEEIKPAIIKLLDKLETEYEGCQNDKGKFAVYTAAKEMRQKLCGNCDTAGQKYFYIDFLKDGNILLDENYQPELYGTFCSLPDFNILQRIKNHAAAVLPNFSERVDELLSGNMLTTNLRSAGLIRNYAEETGNSELAGHEMFGYLDNCISSGKNRFKRIHEDFLNELELLESCGSISDIDGEKTAMVKISNIWYKICYVTKDFGFYASLIEVYKQAINAGTQEKAGQLLQRLEELDVNPNYNFGAYPKSVIENFIKDRNFTVAENMMNCVIKGDINEIEDFSLEPFSYFEDFIKKYNTYYKIVKAQNDTIEKSILNYEGKKNIEKYLGLNSVRKDSKGGASLIQNWIYTPQSTSETKIAKILGILGFDNITVTEESSNTTEKTFIAQKQKQTGIVNYLHPIPAFGSAAETEGFRVLCLFGTYDCDRLIDKFKQINSVSKHTLVLLDFTLKLDERRRLARKIKEEKSFSRTFAVVDRLSIFYIAKHYAANTVNRMLMAITMPFAYYQPFVAKSSNSIPPELFTGRTEQLRSIENPEGANLVYGGRQLGKSALLKMAAKNIDGNSEHDRAVVVELNDLNYTEAADRVSYELVRQHILPEGCQCSDWETLSRHISKRLEDTNPQTRIHYLLLLLDEADSFIESCKEVSYKPISVFKNLPSNRFKLVMAGLHNLSKFNRTEALHNNSVLAHFESLVVHPFNRHEATELLTKTLAYLGLRFDPDVISHIIAKTNFFPGIIQLYCQKLLEAMQEDYAGYNESETPPYNVTESHIKKVLSDKSFTDEVKNRLEMTLHVNDKSDNSYYIIALILAYLNFEEPKDKGYKPEKILEFAKEFNVMRISGLSNEQLAAILDEMCDLNILSSIENHYTFSTDGFRDLLGNRITVMENLDKFIARGGR